MTTLELLSYYSDLLILQYKGKPKAYATIQALVNPVIMAQTTTQEISFSIAPTTGLFTLSYNGNSTVSINWNDSASTIQSDLRSLDGLLGITVSGSIAALSLVVTFVGVIPPALSLLVESNSLEASNVSVGITITETDLTLPLAVQNAFNLLGDDIATGVQLDVLGKYAGVTRSGVGSAGPVTLNDSDFLILIQFAIVQNSAGSDLSSIVNNLYNFFGNNVLVFDYQNMHMSYLINSSFGSQGLIQLLIAEGLLPAPMTVQVSVIYSPVIDNFFGFVTYQNPVAMNNSPFNTYEDYEMDRPWLDYSDSITPVGSMLTEDNNIIVQENGDALFLG